MSDTPTSNYEKVFEHYRALFLVQDHEKAARKLLLEIDGQNLYVPYFHRQVALRRDTGEMRFEAGGTLSVEDRLLILHHLYFCREDASLSGEMAPLRALKGLMHFWPAFENATLLPLARAFSGRAGRFAALGEALGGKPEPYGDASFTIRAFPCIPIRYIFWDGDDELPATAAILFDKNITQWIHPESVPVLAAAGAKRLNPGSSNAPVL